MQNASPEKSPGIYSAMPPENADMWGPSVIEALRAESRYRTWFATLVVTTIAVVYLGGTFPFLLDRLPALNPVGHIVAALILFAISLAVVGAMISAAMEIRRRSSDLAPLRTASVRRMLRELNQIFGTGVVAVAFGGIQDRRILAMRIKGHQVVGIGRGALPLIKRQPGGFRYRLAHEYVHLAAGDPSREQWLSVVYSTAMLFLLISYGSTLSNAFSVLASIGSMGGWAEVKKALLGWMRFGFIANVVLFGSILLMQMLERRSAARLREFYADAAAAMEVGPVKHVFAAIAPVRSRLRRLWSRLLDLHPEPTDRAAAIVDHTIVYRTDMMLFVLRGFFSAFILEMAIQLLFTSASPTLASFDDRRASVWRYFAINSAVTGGMITFSALLTMIAHVLVLTRVAATARVTVERRARFGLIAGVPFLTAAGTLLLLATSEGNLWDLHQSGWSLPLYMSVAWDRLALHGAALLTLCSVIVLLFFLKPRRLAAFLALGSLPVLVTLLLGYLLYG